MNMIRKSSNALARVGLTLALSLSVSLNAVSAEVNRDPLEPINRGVFAFNQFADRWLFRPLAKTYADLAPGFVQLGVGNALRNLRDVNYAVNSLFQGRLDDAASNAGRFVVNSTVGLAGTIDVATDAGLESSYADFGQTLAIAGIPEGPFVMLPVFGPSTVRDGAGFAVDAAVLSVPAHIESADARAAIWGTALVHTRAQLLGIDELITGDRYIFMRDAYMQRRRGVLLGEGFELEIDAFGDFGDFDDELDDEIGEAL